MEEVRDAVLDLREGVRGDRISLTLVLTSRQPQGRALSPRYQLLVATKSTKSCCVSKFAGDLLIYCDTPSCPLVSLSVPVCFAEGAYTVLHSVTLQWPAAPPGRMASLLNRSPVILP